MFSSTEMILRMLQKKYHHQVNDISVEEILKVMNEMSIELGILLTKAEVIRDNQKFIQDLLLNRLKEGVDNNSKEIG